MGVRSAPTPPNDQEPADLNPEARKLLDQGVELYDVRRDYAKGVALIEKAVALDPRMPTAYNILFLYYGLTMKDMETAKKRLESGAAVCPKSSSIRMNLGNAYSALHRPSDAIEQFKLALSLTVQPDSKMSASVHYNIGNEQANQGNTAAAIESWRQALKHDDRHLNARRNLTIGYVNLGQIDKAKAEARKLVDLDPSGEKGMWAREALKRL